MSLKFYELRHGTLAKAISTHATLGRVHCSRVACSTAAECRGNPDDSLRKSGLCWRSCTREQRKSMVAVLMAAGTGNANTDSGSRLGICCQCIGGDIVVTTGGRASGGKRLCMRVA